MSNSAVVRALRLGHSDTRTTLETYTHVFEDKKKEQQLQYMHRG